jgi:23S rRNA pseudouridine1911/1915/1917 synthase
MNIEILYEDADILAINKPAGLVVHSDGRTQEPTVAEWFVGKYPGAKDVGEKQGGIERPGIVHRIDRETSGVLLLAKTQEGFEVLKKQFQNREIDKTYHAFVYGDVKEDRGTITLPIGRSTGDFRKFSTTSPNPLLSKERVRGEVREAVTYFSVLKRSPEQGLTLIEAKPKTGRTHQIRVHFQSLGNPVVGDSLYAPGKEKILGFERLALHARQITFKDVQGGQHSVLANYPEDFKRALDLAS